MTAGGHVIDRLAPFADGAIEPSAAADIASHLSTCEPCREAWARHRIAADALRQLPLVDAPPAIWAAIDAALDARAPGGAPRSRWAGRSWWAAAAVVFAGVSAAMLLTDRAAPWDVVRIDEASQPARLAIGDWIETDATSVARIGIGEIGTVDVEPRTRLQLLAARPGEHRLHLAVGSISAEIVAPPRIFFVETPSSTVVDLGCAYTMQVDQDGAGMLRVTGGWAALEWEGRTSLVPAGASCPTRPRAGPGTPVFDDASERLREALVDFDFGPEPNLAIDAILSEARERDTLTLWHLMSRVDAGDRARVFDRIVALAPLPAGVDRDRALALDPDTMTRWREELAWTW